LGDYLAAKTNWEIVIPALDGHGEELDLEEASYETWLDETEQALIDLKANCDKLYVVGFSMGGMIAAYLAANYDVDKLVLLSRSEEHTSELQSRFDLVCRLLLEKKNKICSTSAVSL